MTDEQHSLFFFCFATKAKKRYQIKLITVIKAGGPVWMKQDLPGSVIPIYFIQKEKKQPTQVTWNQL